MEHDKMKGKSLSDVIFGKSKTLASNIFGQSPIFLKKTYEKLIAKIQLLKLLNEDKMKQVKDSNTTEQLNI